MGRVSIRPNKALQSTVNPLRGLPSAELERSAKEMKLVPITPDSPRPDDIQSDDPTIQDIIDGTRQMYSLTGCTPPWLGYLATLEAVEKLLLPKPLQ